MAIYRQVQTTFWQDAFVLSLTPEEKYFYLYLMTNSKTKQCGIYELPLQIAQIETGYNRETVIKLIQKFIEFGKVAFDWETSEIALKNWMKYNPDNNPKIAQCVKKELSQVKNESLIKFIGYPIQGVSQQEEEEEKEEEEEYIAEPSKPKGKPQDIVEVTKYGEEIGLSPSDCEGFFDYFESNGWKVGGKAPMKNWQSALRNWKRNKDKFKGNANAGTFSGVRKSDTTARATYEKSPEQVREDVRNTTESIRLLYEQRGKRP